MKGSETRMTAFMEGADKRYIIPVYQRKYDWKQENCRQLYEDLKKVIQTGRSSHFFGSIVSSVIPTGSKIEYHIIDGQQRLTTVSLLLQFGHRMERYTRHRRSPLEQDLIARAKALLMERDGLTEEQAHRTLQKRSMDQGLTLVQTARRTLAQGGG